MELDLSIPSGRIRARTRTARSSTLAWKSLWWLNCIRRDGSPKHWTCSSIWGTSYLVAPSTCRVWTLYAKYGTPEGVVYRVSNRRSIENYTEHWSKGWFIWKDSSCGVCRSHCVSHFPRNNGNQEFLHGTSYPLFCRRFLLSPPPPPAGLHIHRPSWRYSALLQHLKYKLTAKDYSEKWYGLDILYGLRIMKPILALTYLCFNFTLSNTVWIIERYTIGNTWDIQRVQTARETQSWRIQFSL